MRPASRDDHERSLLSGPAERPPDTRERTLTLRGATVLGVGSMIGAGIFALLGEAGAVAGAAVWISFLVGGAVAGLLPGPGHVEYLPRLPQRHVEPLPAF